MERMTFRTKAMEAVVCLSRGAVSLEGEEGGLVGGAVGDAGAVVTGVGQPPGCVSLGTT